MEELPGMGGSFLMSLGLDLASCELTWPNIEGNWHRVS